MKHQPVTPPPSTPLGTADLPALLRGNHLIPAKRVAEYVGVKVPTLLKWSEEQNFPNPLWLRNMTRIYWHRDDLVEWLQDFTSQIERQRAGIYEDKRKPVLHELEPGDMVTFRGRAYNVGRGQRIELEEVAL